MAREATENNDSASDLYWSAVEKGREVARASRHDGLNDKKLAELLPELPDDERRVLGENIENAIKDEVKNALTWREREANK